MDCTGNNNLVQKLFTQVEDKRDKETRQLGREGVRGHTGRNQCTDTDGGDMRQTKHKRKPVLKKTQLFIFYFPKLIF